MRELCLGGSFNPIHVGHLLCARVAAERSGHGCVRLIPTAANPHKPAADLAAAADRLAMCQAAVDGDPFFVVDDRELRRPGVSFTFDTVRELRAEGVANVAWLVGTDLLPRLHTWHRFDELAAEASFVVMRRSGQTIDPAELEPRVRAMAARMVTVPEIEVSSTAIRARVRGGISVEHFVPRGVARCIALRDLYRDRPPAAGL